LRISLDIRNEDRNSKFFPGPRNRSTADTGQHRALESMLFHHHEDKAGQCSADAEGQRERTHEDKHRGFRICARHRVSARLPWYSLKALRLAAGSDPPPSILAFRWVRDCSQHGRCSTVAP